MIKQTDIPLSNGNFTTSATATGFFYDIEDGMKGNTTRPVVIVCPGGGYRMISERETEPIAMQFLANGYHAVILRYTVGEHTFPSQLIELSKVIVYLREHAKELKLDPDQIVLQGCSAGGHLVVSYCELWKDELITKNYESSVQKVELLRPNAAILCYPAILFDDFIYYLMDQEQYPTYLEHMHLEEYVNAEFPRTFIWHTFEDSIAKADNSIALVKSLYEMGISTEFHMYAKGEHGRSIARDFVQPVGADELPVNVDSWVGLACKWI